MTGSYHPPAPPLQVAQWFNTPEPLTLDGLRGRVVLLHTFQMLCPGCVEQGIPQARRVHEAFSQDRLVVIGLHTVFEHHAVQGTPAALQAFIHEYRLRFPIGLDQPDPGPSSIPLTMQSLSLSGTPSLVVLDTQGRVRLHHFGHLDDLRLGTLLGRLLAEPTPTAAPPQAAGCDDQGCLRPDTP
ncbi:MAG TPA: redoxin domain-containing protein, partial [Alicycliphilus sp.]|nr:redoxin domain-containing protein [Alicycliphilus sp.]